MNNSSPVPVFNTMYTAFADQNAVASGELAHVVRATKEFIDRGSHAQILIFSDETSQQIEVDFRGTLVEVLERAAVQYGDAPASGSASEKRGPGRPKLGVVSREVTLLPRHWEWLDSQPGGASVALRRLVEAARRVNQGKDRARRSQDAVYRFMTAMAGDFPGFEEALRAFYTGREERLMEIITPWPPSIRDQVKKLVANATRDKSAAEAASPLV